MSINDYLRITRNATILSEKDSNPVVLVQKPQGLYGVITKEGEIVIPFGKYDYIDVFCLGIARVKNGKGSNGVLSSNSKWGIIDTEGNELIPVIYDNIWNYKKGPYTSLRLELGGESIYMPISELLKK